MRSVIHAAFVASLTAVLGQIDDHVAPGDWFGYRTANVGDLDGDGTPDCAVGNPWNYALGVARRAWVFSGFDGRVLFEFEGPVNTADEWAARHVDRAFASGVRGCGDVDADGRPDLLLAAGDRELRVVSGRTGDVLHSIVCPEPRGFRLGTARPFLGLGDVDGDRHADVAVGRFVYSGSDGAFLFALEISITVEEEVLGLFSVGDLDGDGYADIGAGLPTDSPGRVFILSSRDGRLLREWTGLPEMREFSHELLGPERGFGVDIAVAGDLDRDGVEDVLIGSCRSGEGWNRMSAFAGGSGTRLWSYHEYGGYPTNAAFAVGDVDGDCVADFAMPGCVGMASVTAYSGRTRSERWTVDLDSDEGWASWGKLASVERAGDVDRDGVEDLLVSVLQDGSPGLPGYVLLLSGGDGHRIRVYDTPSSLRKVGKRR